MFQPSMARRNRLFELGVTNMHGSIKGQMVLSVLETNAVAKEIVRMQGHIRSKSNEDKWLSGNLFVNFRPLYFNKRCAEFKCFLCQYTGGVFACGS